MYGHQLFLPIPDIDRTSYFLVLGANPMASNGSLMTVPDFPARLRELKARGGRMVVLDPRRTETAQGRHRAPLRAAGHRRPRAAGDGAGAGRRGPDPAPVVRRRAGRRDRGRRRLHPRAGRGRERRARRARSAASPASSPRPTARWPTGGSGSPRTRSAPVCQWAVQLLNLLTGNLDRVGGAMLTTPAIDAVGTGLIGRGHHDVWRSRVRGLPEFAGELPVAALREEIETPGDGQVRALLTVAGQPRPLDARRRRGWTGRSAGSTSWRRSTSTSTRPPGTPT